MKPLVPAAGAYRPTLATAAPRPAGARVATALAAAAAWAMHAALAVALGCMAVFVAGFALPLSINRGPEAAPALAVTVDLALLTLLAATHAVTTDARFRRLAARHVPGRLAEALPNGALAAALTLTMAAWLPVGGTVWQAGAPWNSLVLALMGLGFAMAVVSPFVAGELTAHAPRRRARSGEPERPAERLVPELVAVGMAIGVWAAPTMTAGHALFSTVLTAYAFVFLIRRHRRPAARTIEEGAPHGASFRFGAHRPAFA